MTDCRVEWTAADGAILASHALTPPDAEAMARTMRWAGRNDAAVVRLDDGPAVAAAAARA
jgi:hypothetical protein